MQRFEFTGDEKQCPAVLARHGQRLLPWLHACLALWLLCAPLHAQQAKPTEYQVKAAYLYNFSKFISWPDSASAGNNSFSICVLGQDPFGKTLDETLEGATWEGKSVTPRRITRVEEASDCEILFISPSESDQINHILTALAKQPVLTVSDAPQFSRRGGAVEFVVSDNRVRFEVNLTAAEQAGLTLSSQLLKVAVHVRRGPQPGER